MSNPLRLGDSEKYCAPGCSRRLDAQLLKDLIPSLKRIVVADERNDAEEAVALRSLLLIKQRWTPDDAQLLADSDLTDVLDFLTKHRNQVIAEQAKLLYEDDQYSFSTITPDLARPSHSSSGSEELDIVTLRDNFLHGAPAPLELQGRAVSSQQPCQYQRVSEGAAMFRPQQAWGPPGRADIAGGSQTPGFPPEREDYTGRIFEHRHQLQVEQSMAWHKQNAAYLGTATELATLSHPNRGNLIMDYNGRHDSREAQSNFTVPIAVTRRSPLAGLTVGQMMRKLEALRQLRQQSMGPSTTHDVQDGALQTQATPFSPSKLPLQVYPSVVQMPLKEGPAYRHTSSFAEGNGGPTAPPYQAPGGYNSSYIQDEARKALVPTLAIMGTGQFSNFQQPRYM
eukprot:jgi/Botrbrau1/14699/Bobra.0108s0053.1